LGCKGRGDRRANLIEFNFFGIHLDSFVPLESIDSSMVCLFVVPGRTIGQPVEMLQKV
jgi:hypothetical protein